MGVIDQFGSILENTINQQRTNKAEDAKIIKILFQAEVVDVFDPLKASRIKVFIPGVDDHLINEKSKLPWSNCLLPTNFQHLPKVGERVIIIFENPWKKNSGRWWIGPVFSQNITTDESFDSSLGNSGL